MGETFWARPTMNKNEWSRSTKPELGECTKLSELVLVLKENCLVDIIGVTVHNGDRCFFCLAGWMFKPAFEITDDMVEWLGYHEPDKSLWELISGETNDANR